MRPVHGAQRPAVARLGCGFDQSRSTDFLVAARAEAGDDEIAPVVVDEKAIAVTHDVTLRPARLLDRDSLRLPDTLTGICIEAAQLAETAQAIEVVPLNHRRADHRMQSVGLDFAVALALPQDASCWTVVLERQHERSVIEARHEQA